MFQVDVNAIDKEGLSALCHAARANFVDTVSFLIDHGPHTAELPTN